MQKKTKNFIANIQKRKLTIEDKQINNLGYFNDWIKEIERAKKFDESIKVIANILQLVILENKIKKKIVL